MLKLEIGQAPQIRDPQPFGEEKNASTKRFVVTTCFWVPTVGWKYLKSVWPKVKETPKGFSISKEPFEKKNNLPEITKKKHDKYTCQLEFASISLNLHHKENSQISNQSPRSAPENSHSLFIRSHLNSSNAFLNWFHPLVWHSFHGLEFKKHGTKNLESQRECSELKESEPRWAKLKSSSLSLLPWVF